MKPERVLLSLVILAPLVSNAGTLFNDDFSASSLNALSPGAPTSDSTAYQLFSSKSWSPAPGITSSDLKFGIASTSSGHIEAQALFSPIAVALTNIGDYIELSVTFDNTVGLFTSSGVVGFGIYNSGGVAPIAGGMESTAVSGTTGVTGGAQGWQGYVSRIAYDGGSHRIATRPAQTITTGNNQDLVTEGSGSQSYLNGATLASASSTFSQAAGSQLTETLRYTLTAANMLQIDSRLYSGSGTNGPLLVSQTAAASGVNYFTNSFDALCVGWRMIGTNGVGSLIDIRNIKVTTSLPVGDAGDTVAGIYFQQQPTDANAGTALSPAVTVVATNSSGAPVTNAPITLSLASGSGSLDGTLLQATDDNGAATFADLSLSESGVKQLQASSGVKTALSATFNISALDTVAFPGAEGAGAHASGGRGGDVYYVTSLADGGTGSLRSGISGAPAGGRTICFKVSGNIALNSTLTINKPNITVAGQTAPGDGICIQDESFNIAANNVIVRHIRTRLGTNNLAEADGMWINAGTNIVVDHVSASWSVDETLSASRHVSNLTVQNCFITESLRNSTHVKGAHGYGGIVSSSDTTTYSYHHNLYAHHDSRNPRVGSDIPEATLRLDFRNNVIYDWGFRAGYTGGTNEFTEINYVNNYLIAGPTSTSTSAFLGGGDTTHIFQSGNLIDNNKNGLIDGINTGWSMFTGVYTATNAAFDVPAMPTDSPAVACQRVVALSGAMPWRRDPIDQRIAATVRQQGGHVIDFVNPTTFAGDYITNTDAGTIGVNPWPALASESAPTDTDADGMPNYWEVANGLNPILATDRNVTNPLTGYTKLEEYLNWLADPHALCYRNGFVDVSLRTATGGATNLSYIVTAGANGSVTLLGDGYTARFVADANTNGVANFTFTATGNGTTFGPIRYGILITTTNAPVANTPPALAAIPPLTVMAGSNVNFTCSATDTDTPPQAITFSLQDGPTGATVGGSNGQFNWRPTIAQSGTTNTMSIIATDNGTPAMSATQVVSIAVLRPVQPLFQQTSLDNGRFGLQINGDAGPDYTIQASTNLNDWSELLTTNPPALPFLWSDSDSTNFPARFYRVLLGP